MRHIHGVVELRHIHHPEGRRGIANPNFPQPSADSIHGLPVVRLAPTLYLVELIPPHAASLLETRANFGRLFGHRAWMRETPTVLEFAVNKTIAKSLDLNIPLVLLARTDEVIG